MGGGGARECGERGGVWDRGGGGWRKALIAGTGRRRGGGSVANCHADFHDPCMQAEEGTGGRREKRGGRGGLKRVPWVKLGRKEGRALPMVIHDT